MTTRRGDKTYNLWHSAMMTAFRHILGERALSTALVMLVSYSLLFQAYVGTMLGPASTPTTAIEAALHVICTSSEMDTNVRSADDGEPRDHQGCPCAFLCRLAAASVPVVLASWLWVGLSVTDIADRFLAPATQPIFWSRDGILPEPRGPPSWS